MILAAHETPLIIRHLRTLIRAGLTRSEAVSMVHGLLTCSIDPVHRPLSPILDEIYRLERETRNALVGDALASAANAMLAGNFTVAQRYFEQSDRLEGKT